MSAESATMRTIETKIPARLDRLPWAKWHWLVVLGLGLVWILDGLEVTIVGTWPAGSPRRTALGLTESQVTGLRAMYVAGACAGALFFGRLTDRFGRKKLFMLTLGVYLAATARPRSRTRTWWFFLFRFLTGFGIGGEYAAINSAIDELIPSKLPGPRRPDHQRQLLARRHRRLAAVVVALNTGLFPADVGWRITFALGVRAGPGASCWSGGTSPSSPRWLFIHGRERGGRRAGARGRAEGRGGQTGRELPPAEGRRHHASSSAATIGFGRSPTSFRLPAARRARLLPLHRPGVPLQRDHLRFRRDPHHVLRRPDRRHRVLLRRHRRRQLRSARCCSASCSTRSAAGHDLARPTCCPACCSSAPPGCSTGALRRGDPDGLLVRGAVLRLGRRLQRLPDGLRDLPDGDPRDGHRLLLRHRHGRRRHQRPADFAELTSPARGRDTVLAFRIGAGLMCAAGLVAAFLAVAAERRSLEDIAEPLSAEDADPTGSSPRTGQRSVRPRRGPRAALRRKSADHGPGRANRSCVPSADRGCAWRCGC